MTTNKDITGVCDKCGKHHIIGAGVPNQSTCQCGGAIVPDEQENPPFPIPPNCDMFFYVNDGIRKGWYFHPDGQKYLSWSHDSDFPMPFSTGVEMTISAMKMLASVAESFWREELRRCYKENKEPVILTHRIPGIKEAEIACIACHVYGFGEE